MSQLEGVEKIKTHFIFNNIFIFEKCAFREPMCKNTLQPDRLCDSIIWRMRIACWINKATNTRSELIIISFQRQERLRDPS